MKELEKIRALADKKCTQKQLERLVIRAEKANAALESFLADRFPGKGIDMERSAK